MKLNRYALIAGEGIPALLINALMIVLALRFLEFWLAVPLLLSLVLLFLLFRDPYREVPIAPRAVLGPVDGRIVEIEQTNQGLLRREAIRVVIKANWLGAYTVRSPIEGKVLDPRDNVAAGSRLLGISGLWVHSDEGDDVVLLFRGIRGVGVPHTFTRYGERLGQGQRFAYLRLAKYAELYLPLDIQVKVEVGDTVVAGTDVIAQFIRNGSPN